MASALRWLAVLVIAAATVLVGAVAHADSGSSESTVPPSTVSGPTTSVPAQSGSPNLYPASFSPCTSDGSAATGEPCNETPLQVVVSYPPGPPPDAVTLAWDPSGDSAAAPSPEQTSVTLDSTSSDGTTVCDTQARTCTWSWPAGMEDGGFVLNGTYKVSVCPAGDYTPSTGSGSGGTCDISPPAQSTGRVAVPPGPPTSVTSYSAGAEVTLQWHPPAQAPPDLAGYSVARNGTTIYTCSVDTLGPGASTPCPSSLELADHPGNGKWAYTVTALRLGVDSAAGDVVASEPAGASSGAVTVPGPVTSATTTPTGGGGGQGTTVGLSGGSGGTGTVTGGTGGTVTGVGPVSGGNEVALGQSPATAPSGGVSAPIPNLSYPTSPDPAARHPQSLALKVDSAPNHNDVVPVAVLALGILSLAVAAHFLYLRVEMGVVQARLAARRYGGA